MRDVLREIDLIRRDVTAALDKVPGEFWMVDDEKDAEMVMPGDWNDLVHEFEKIQDVLIEVERKLDDLFDEEVHCA